MNSAASPQPDTGDALPSIHAYDVKGMDCPACGHPTLMILGGYITCTLAECPNPDFSETIAAEKEMAAAEARIDELEKISDIEFGVFQDASTGHIVGAILADIACEVHEHINSRLAALRSTQEARRQDELKGRDARAA